MANQAIGFCPVCNEKLFVKTFKCNHCNTEVSGDFEMSPFDYLTNEQKDFALVFIKCQGNIKDVEKIINNASRSKREALMSVWSKISEQSNVFAVQILVRGKIVAVSDDAFIVELQDLSFCNRVMSYENYLKIIEVFNEAGVSIKDYICIPSKTWSEIIKDYKAKYNKIDNPKPELANIRIGVKRRIEPKKEKDTLEEKISTLFEENTLKIMEE